MSEQLVVLPLAAFSCVLLSETPSLPLRGRGSRRPATGRLLPARLEPPVVRFTLPPAAGDRSEALAHRRARDGDSGRRSAQPRRDQKVINTARYRAPLHRLDAAGRHRNRIGHQPVKAGRRIAVALQVGSAGRGAEDDAGGYSSTTAATRYQGCPAAVDKSLRSQAFPRNRIGSCR